MVEIRAVGFDLDGTLFDHRGSAIVGVDRFLESLGIGPSQDARALWFAAEEEQLERWRSRRIDFQEQRRERLRTVLPALGVQAPTEAADLDALFALYLRGYRAAWRSFEDSVELVQRVKATGRRVGLLTNGAEEQQLDKLRVTGLLEVFDHVCISESIGVQKPDPAAFRLLSAGLSVAPQECLFVGDNPLHDIDGARAVGMSALLVDRYGAHREGIEEAVMAQLE
ncbi:HAD family hydrolase [Agreia pratensis]|uniref:HAD family hydrolase n=1 Tax=Agreia pratensis TaxID=150121 RepID=UPI00188B8B46|nr:HAD family hydrolase [Agreia pratensis]MBF4636017.1 HAD family hydrolase [Agreia pratensis]